MAYQFDTVREKDLGAGLDQQSAENQIAPGYCEDIENADPKSTGQLVKRRGYQGFAGNIPVRVNEISYVTSTEICFTLDEQINLANIRDQPIIVYGRSGLDSEAAAAGGDFPSTTDTVQYYPSTRPQVRKTFIAGTSSIVIPQTEHDFTTNKLWVGVTRATDEDSTANSLLIPDSISIDKSTSDITITYTNNTGAAIEVFVFISDKRAEVGVTYISPTTSILTGTNTYSVPKLGAGGHGLDNSNILLKVYKDTGTAYELVVHDEFTIQESNSDTVITMVNSGAAFDAIFILTRADDDKATSGTVSAGSSATVTIPLDGVAGSSDFAFVACYLEPSIGADLEQVMPDSIEADGTEITITFINNGAAGANFEVFWDFSNIRTNIICVDAHSSTTPYIDLSPQLTLWGLDHSEIYTTDIAREGWTTHIDSYKSEGENRLIAGLGGNLFAARLEAEGSNSASYLMPTLYPYIRGRVTTDRTLAPVFSGTGEATGRTRGYMTADGALGGYAEVTDITYATGTGYVNYTISLPNLKYFDSVNTEGTVALLTGMISTAQGFKDRLTVQQTGHSVFNGDFEIAAVTAGVDSIIISVINPDVNTSDYDETDVGGLAGVFTDTFITTGSNNPFLIGDELNSDNFAGFLTLEVVQKTTTISMVSGVLDRISMPGGLRLVAKRTARVIPLRTATDALSVDNIVRGDMLTWTDLERQLRVKYVNTASDSDVTLTGDGETVTLVMTSGDTENLHAGQTITLRNTINHDGEHTILDLVSSTELTFASTETTSSAGVLIGRTIEIDESLTIEDTLDNSKALIVHSRWIPVEAPDDSFDLTPTTHLSYFDTNDYVSQPTLRSTMVEDNLYLTNGDDEVMKFDGTNVYRAGLFRWQPQMFTTTDSSVTGKISVEPAQVTVLAVDENRFEVDPDKRLSFSIGSRITHDGDSYTVTNTDVVTTAGTEQGYIYVERTIESIATGTLNKRNIFSYYFRLNAVDSNNNIIASAATGSDDFRVNVPVNAAVNIRLLGMPAWDVYDYDRLEVQIYRTKSNGAAPYYLLTTIAMDFNTASGYIDYTDANSDGDLRDLDGVNTALKGAELGTAWTNPPRAKYCTSAGNRLILGNVKSYPKIDVQLQENSGRISAADFTASGNSDWTLVKDNTQSFTGTDMNTQVRYSFTTNTLVVSGITGNAGTSFTVTTTTPHSLAPNTWVYLCYNSVSGSRPLTYCGWWQVASTAGNTFTINFSGAEAGAATNFPTVAVKADAGINVPVFLGLDGNYETVEGNLPAGTDPAAQGLAMSRLANAVNASMRKVDRTLSGYEGFEPWVIAHAGADFNFGQIVFDQPKTVATTLELQLPGLTGAFDVFANNVRRAADAQVGALTRIYPSRLLVSYSNYPELFDNPNSILDSESDSAIDINSADGQEITAVIPFFGDAAFGAAQKSGIIVVFKTNSIYVVDLAQKDAGGNAVQKLESRGKGCTAPYSVSVTRNGVMFANDTGIYRLTRDLRVEYVGRKYERKWLNQVNEDLLGLATGHHDTFSNSYKLSYPEAGETENAKVAVYNHTREYEQKGEGSWTTYTNHPSTGWANLLNNSYFATNKGRVFSIRRTGEIQDYRDDSQPIDLTILTRAMDMGLSGKRKIFSKIITHYRTVGESLGTTLEAAMNLNNVYQETDTFNINKQLGTTNFGDFNDYKIATVTSVIKNKVGVYLQLRYKNNTLDEPLEIAGIDIRLAVTSGEGITEAVNTIT